MTYILITMRLRQTKAKMQTLDTVGLDNVPGYSRVLALAHFLVTFKDKAAMTSAEVQKLKDL